MGATRAPTEAQQAAKPTLCESIGSLNEVLPPWEHHCYRAPELR
jgi:hypothetical protein